LTLTSVGDVDSNPLLGQADTLRGLALFYWPMGWFSNAIANHSVLDIVYLSVSHIILFVGFLLLVSKVAIKTNQLAQVTVSGKSKQQYRVVSQTSFVTLIKKEARKFLASPLYALNSGIGIVIMLLFAIIGLFSKEAIGSFLPLLEGEGMSPSLIIIIFIGFCIAMTYTPAISLSLEGKNIWIIKSLPLRANTMMWAKITFNLLLGVPAGLVALILFGISLSVSPFELGALLLFVPSLGFLISTSDAIINLLFPKIEFSNEAEVIKQSVAALFAIFGGFAIIAINGFGFYFLATLIHPALAILAITLFNALLGFMCLLWINRFSERYLKQI
jgi:ABC-2 type transport system permease protein